MTRDTTLAYLWVTDYGDDAAVVTELIGIQPTRSVRRGDRIHPDRTDTDVRARRSWWKLESPADDTEPFESVLRALLDLLEPHQAAIRSASQQFYVQINIATTDYDTNTGYHFDHDVVQRIAALGCSIDMDTYNRAGCDDDE